MARDVLGSDDSGGGLPTTAIIVQPEDYGARGDCLTTNDAAMANGSQTITSVSNPWTSADVGKTLMITGPGINGQGAVVTATITGFNSAGSITVSVAASQAATGCRCTWGTDDTAAIRLAFDSAIEEALDSSYFAEIRFSAKEYMVAGAPSTVYSGNAQIPLPYVSTLGKKLILSIQGPGEVGFYHWKQIVAQSSGAVLRSPLLNQSSGGAVGLPSVIGCPNDLATDGGTEPFSNIHVAISGITVMMPRNPSYVALDFYRAGQCNVGSLQCLVDATPTEMSTIPTNANGLGLRMPRFQNNDETNVYSYACEGFYYGLTISDHFVAQRLAIIYCQTAIFGGPIGSGAQHGAFIGYVSCEACDNFLEFSANAGGKYPIFIGRLDCEVTGAGVTFRDTNNALYGEVHFAHNSSSNPTFNGGTNLKVINDNQARGAVTAPSVPASTTPLTNPFYRDAVINVAGGTVTAITVAGTATGLTSGTVIVPSGKTVALTYSVAPTWVWTLL